MKKFLTISRILKWERKANYFNTKICNRSEWLHIVTFYKMLTKKDIDYWITQSVSCCHNLDLTILILDLRNVLVDEVPNGITKSQLRRTNLLILWLAEWVGKIKWRANPELWLTSCLANHARCVLQTFTYKPYNKSSNDQALLVKMAGYWPSLFFVSLWTSTLSWSIYKQKIENG